MGRCGRWAVGSSGVVLVLVAAAACSDGEESAAADRTAQVVEAIVRDYAAEVVVDGDAVPVVFVAEAGDGAELTIEVQVATVDAVHDDVDVRFVDDREEAIDTDADGSPLKEPGVLLGLGPIPADDPVVVEVERYVDESDRSDDVVELTGDDDGFVVTDRSSVTG